MKNSKYVLIFIFTFMFFNSCFNNLKAIDYPLDIDVVLIQFNYDLNSYSEDAYSIVPGYNSLVIQNEWINDGGISKNDKIAYIKSQTNRKIKVKFWHNQNQSVSYNFIIGNAVSEGTSFGYAPYTSVYFPSNNNGYSEVKTYQLNGTVPSSVGKRYVKFAWQCTNYALSLGYTGKHYYYTLLAAPQAPMGTPWTSVLDYACVWASGETTETNVLTNITEGAFYNFDVDYDGGQTHAPGNTFYLTNLLSDTIADCRDMSAIVQIFTNALGCSTVQVRRILGSFNTRIIDPIGAPGWIATSWLYHQVAWKSNVWDACLRLDSSGPRIPVNESIDGTYKRNLYFSGDWDPASPTSFTTIY